MNKLTIIGALTRDPELRTTNSGKNVCSFTVAVNRPKRNGQDQGADYFKVSAWNEQGISCSKYLEKGKKVCVIGPVSVRAYTNNKGEPAASLEVTANEVEFLSPRGEGQPAQPEPQVDQQTGFQQVAMDDSELPF